MQALDCTDIKATLSGLVDDEVDATTRHAAERHLADCRTCRRLIDDAEALNDLIAAETDAVRRELPAGFHGAVLERTVHARTTRPGGHGWTNWFGWLAAAASLLLAVSLLVMDRPKAPAGDAPAAMPRTVTPARSTFRQSSVFDGVAAAAANDESEIAGAADAPSGAATGSSAGTRRATPLALASGPLLAREDAETLDSAALALETLIADDATFGRLGEIRQIVEYEELLPRLAESRQRLSAEDRPAVFACESALFRVLYGSSDATELAELAAAIERSELAGQLTKISGRWTAAQSL